MTKNKLVLFALFASVAVGLAAIFCVEAHAQFQPCVYPRTCGSL